jgi:DNA-binding SARP family transcriptional activator
MSLLQLSLLGVPEVKHGERLVTFSTRKAQALLIYLAVEGGVHTRKILSESLWEELDAAHGRAALRATLQELRKLLDSSHTPDEYKHLEVTHDTLRFNSTSQFILDLHTIEFAYKQIREVTGQTNTISDASRHDLLKNLEQATLLARGPFLENFSLRASQFFDDWTLQQGEHWHKRVHQVFDTLSLLQERTGDVENAIDTVSRWLSYDSLHEEGHRRLMRLRFSQGDRAGALRAFVTCRSILAAKLQIEPEPDTIALAERIRLAPVPRLTKVPGSPLTQPPSSLLNHPFVGRTKEFDALIKHYQRVAIGQAQVVLLKGERGIGKTRLVNEFLNWAQTQGADVLAGQTLQTGEQLPYQPLVDALRRRMAHGVPSRDLLSDVWLAELSHVLPELLDRYPDLGEPVMTRALWKNRLCEATTRLFCAYATRRPVIFFLDDVQWADTATLDLLLYLSQRLTEQRAPLLLLFCLNTEISPDPRPLSTWLVALQRGSLPVTSLQLRRFTKEEIRRFIQSLAWMEVGPDSRTSSGSTPAALTALTDWLFTRTRGQPFYLVELFKELLKHGIVTASMQEDGRWGFLLKSELLMQISASELIPTSVQEVIRMRLNQLSPPARALLVASAILLQYPLTDRKNEENLTPLPATPDVGDSNRTIPNRSRGFALEQGLTFERLCQVVHIDEQTGLQALEELLGSQLLSEVNPGEGTIPSGEFSFPYEAIREIAYQEAGKTRQRLLLSQAAMLGPPNA